MSSGREEKTAPANESCAHEGKDTAFVVDCGLLIKCWCKSLANKTFTGEVKGFLFEAILPFFNLTQLGPRLGPAQILAIKEGIFGRNCSEQVVVLWCSINATIWAVLKPELVH
eukprot:969716-Pelagomonas_calceolata.AAC.7